MVIAIDGPAGSGKSTTAKLLAKKIGFIYLDTGAMYRAVTLHFLNNSIDIKNSSEILKLLNNMNLKIGYENNNFTILLDNQVVNKEIRSQSVTNFVSSVSKLPDVRKEMVIMQRSFSNKKDIVVEGRDIGSHVFPNADYKFFIEANIEVRAKRRYDEMADSSLITISEIEQQLESRDNLDSNRSISPLIRAEDAIVIDTTLLSINEQVDKLYNKITK